MWNMANLVKHTILSRLFCNHKQSPSRGYTLVVAKRLKDGKMFSMYA